MGKDTYAMPNGGAGGGKGGGIGEGGEGVRGGERGKRDRHCSCNACSKLFNVLGKLTGPRPER